MTQIPRDPRLSTVVYRMPAALRYRLEHALVTLRAHRVALEVPWKEGRQKMRPSIGMFSLAAVEFYLNYLEGKGTVDPAKAKR